MNASPTRTRPDHASGTHRWWTTLALPVALLPTVLACAVLALAAPSGAASAGAVGIGGAPDLAAARASLQVDETTAAATVAAAVQAAGLEPGATAPTRAAILRRADVLRAAARKAKAAHMFTRANTLYERARDLYLQAGARRQARACLTRMQDIFMYVGSYSRTRAETLEVLSAMYPSVPESSALRGSTCQAPSPCAGTA